MPVNIANIGTPQVVEATFVAQAVDAGILETIRSLVTLATDERTLLIQLKEALAEPNPPLADALNLDTLRAILKYMTQVDHSLGYGEHIPQLLNANGPAAIFPVFYPVDGETPAHVEIGTPDEEQAYRSEYEACHVLIDGGLYYSGALPADPTANLTFPANLGAGEHTARVCYVDAERNTTRLSPVGTFTVP